DWARRRAMKCLVTGASGFLGSHLVDHLVELGHTVVATGRKAPPGGVALDLLDAGAVRAALDAHAPDLVFHLAAQSLPGVAWRDPEATVQANVIGTLHLFDAVRASAKPPAVELFGSASEYARSDAPLAEDAPLEPSNPYALTKIAAS